MQLVELQGNSSFDMIKVRIIRKFDPRTVNIRGSDKTVQDMIIKDASSEGKLTLWGENAGDPYNENEVVILTNGWCKIYNEQVQVSLGRNGDIEATEDDPSIPE